MAGIGAPRASEAIRPERLILAAKTAVAAALAWLLAPAVPLADAEYAYYAPLGVLVSMYPTVAGSARAGFQSAIGLASGVALGLGALGLVHVGVPAMIGVAVVIGLGIVIGGIPALGAGREWVPIAALFVLLLGGPQADDFSLSYLLTMAFGMVIGILTQALVFPPLYLQGAARRLTALRDAVGSCLRHVAAALRDGELEASRLARSRDDLRHRLGVAADEFALAEESSRANPRRRARGGARRLNAQRMAALERTTRATLDLVDALLLAQRQDALGDEEMRRRFAAAVEESAEIVEAPAADARSTARLESAVRALDEAISVTPREPGPDAVASYARAHVSAALLCVRRILDASAEFVEVTRADDRTRS